MTVEHKKSDIKRIVVPMEIKRTSSKGEFSGYASIFGNKDLGWDVIERGAFVDDEIVRNKDGKVKVLYMHNDWSELPVGLAEVTQDDKGLKFEGQLVMEDPFVQRVHTHMKAGTLDGMSIGYSVLPGGAEYLESGVRLLKALKLWEISPVIFGMNPKAGIDTVKGAARFKTIREFEDFLRDAGSLSKADALAAAAAGWKAMQDRRDSGNADDFKQLADRLAEAPLFKVPQ